MGKVTILGDSRTLDTYYYDENYEVWYGYDKSFPYLLQERFMEAPERGVKIIHIPDHFRYVPDGKPVADVTRIRRIMFTDPEIVILSCVFGQKLTPRRNPASGAGFGWHDFFACTYVIAPDFCTC